MNLDTINKNTLGLILNHVEATDICNFRLLNKSIKRNIDCLDNPKHDFETRSLEKKLSTEQWIRKKTQQYCPPAHLPLWHRMEAFFIKYFKLIAVLLVPISFTVSLLVVPISVVGIGAFVLSIVISYIFFFVLAHGWFGGIIPDLMRSFSDRQLNKRGQCMLRDLLNNNNLLTQLKSEYDNTVYDEKKILANYSIFKFEQSIIKSFNKKLEDNTNVLSQVTRKVISFDEAATIMKDRTHAFPAVQFIFRLTLAINSMKKQKLSAPNLTTFKNNLQKTLNSLKTLKL